MTVSHAGATAVVTVVAGRHDHLARQREFLSRCAPAPDLHVVVAIDDPEVLAVLALTSDLPTCLVPVASTLAGLPVAAARNAGAARAVAAGAEVLVFLDVDCLPSPSLMQHFADAVGAQPDVLVCGPVTYLPPAPPQGWTTDGVRAARRPHAARPDPPDGITVAMAPELFWSLSFATSAQAWAELGGFHEGYVGYGAEDTDLAVSAARAGRRIAMIGGAHAFHQHHPVSEPPVEHVDDILRNAAIFRRRHGTVPMRGWLDTFHARGLVEDPEQALRRTDAPRVATVPARHDYVDAVMPGTVRRVGLDRVELWQPDPLFDVRTLDASAGGIDVVHLHFGFDHLPPATLRDWVERVRAHRIGLVVTVHDLRNPHHRNRRRHDEHLAILAESADHLLTLTECAAQRFAESFGRRPEVVPHPMLIEHVPEPDRAAALTPTVLVPLKAVRANVDDAGRVLDAVLCGAERADARVLVLIHPDAHVELPAGRALDTIVAARLPRRRLESIVGDCHAVVLPYRWGTHSGWIELARDLGVHVVAPEVGCYRAQWPAVTPFACDEQRGCDRDSLAAAVTAVCRRPRPTRADPRRREEQRDLVRARHDVLYRELAACHASCT